MIPVLILLPTVAGAISFLLTSNRLRHGIVLATSLSHLILTLSLWPDHAACWANHNARWLDGWLELDPAGLLFLTVTSLLFAAVSVYAIGYLRREAELRRHSNVDEGILYINSPEAIFTGCRLMLLAAMTLVTCCQQLGLLWVAVEATTLACAPLIYFHKHHRSLEATWKYLLACSVGIALALLGNFFLASSAHVAGHSIPLLLSDLVARAGELKETPLKVAFLFLVVGYGTKMGLAPLHTWMPDVYAEAPSLVAALLSGAIKNCAFLAILRGHQICVAAGLQTFSQEILLGFGVLSLIFATIFIVNQKDYKRLLAYSSVDHMGILAIGVGVGGLGIYGALLHAVNHAFIKGGLFLIVGNILGAYRSKAVAQVRGVLRVLPVSGTLWVASFLAITGIPPFGTFVSEFTILRACLDAGHTVAAILFLSLLGMIFVGLAFIFLGMAQGPAPGKVPAAPPTEPLWSVLPAALLLSFSLLLGIWIPAPLNDLLHAAARLFMLGGA